MRCEGGRRGVYLSLGISDHLIGGQLAEQQQGLEKRGG